MNKKEFEEQVAAIQKEKFVCLSDDPLEYGLRRAQFRERQLYHLIFLAKQLPTKSNKQKIADLERQIVKSRTTQERFKSLAGIDE